MDLFQKYEDLGGRQYNRQEFEALMEKNFKTCLTLFFGLETQPVQKQVAVKSDYQFAPVLKKFEELVKMQSLFWTAFIQKITSNVPFIVLDLKSLPQFVRYNSSWEKVEVTTQQKLDYLRQFFPRNLTSLADSYYIFDNRSKLHQTFSIVEHFRRERENLEYFLNIFRNSLTPNVSLIPLKENGSYHSNRSKLEPLYSNLANIALHLCQFKIAMHCGDEQFYVATWP